MDRRCTRRPFAHIAMPRPDVAGASPPVVADLPPRPRLGRRRTSRTRLRTSAVRTSAWLGAGAFCMPAAAWKWEIAGRTARCWPWTGRPLPGGRGRGPRFVASPGGTGGPGPRPRGDTTPCLVVRSAGVVGLRLADSGGDGFGRFPAVGRQCQLMLRPRGGGYRGAGDAVCVRGPAAPASRHRACRP